MGDDEEIILTTGDTIFTLTYGVVKCMGTVFDTIEDIGVDYEIPLPNIDVATLEKVILYCRAHSKKNKDELVSWDKHFIEVYDKATVCKLILAANYTDLPGLLKLACDNISMNIKGKTTPQMRTILNVSNDWNEGEEEAVRGEHPWSRLTDS